MGERTLHKDGSSALLNIALEKEGEKRKKSSYNMGYSYLVTHPSTIPAYRKTKNPFGTKNRLNISFQLLLYLIKVKYQ